MADGKVMQKYYPPDFDPELLRKNKDLVRRLGKRRRRGPRLMEMRMMFPFTLCCENCKDFVYVGTKFNSKVERIRGEDYLGIAIWRFYGRCPHCRHQIVMRTDPKNTDYVLEAGGTRTYDSHRDARLAEEALADAEKQALVGDAVRALEVKSYSTAEELRTLEALDELRRLNRRFFVRPDELGDFALQKLKERYDAKEEDMDEEEMREAREVFRKKEFGESSSEEQNEAEVSEADQNIESNGSREEPGPHKGSSYSASSSSSSEKEEEDSSSSSSSYSKRGRKMIRNEVEKDVHKSRKDGGGSMERSADRIFALEGNSRGLLSNATRSSMFEVSVAPKTSSVSKFLEEDYGESGEE